MVTFANLTFLYFFVFGSFLGQFESSPEVSYYFLPFEPKSFSYLYKCFLDFGIEPSHFLKISALEGLVSYKACKRLPHPNFFYRNNPKFKKKVYNK